MSEDKEVLRRQIWILGGMVNVLVKQMDDIAKEVYKLTDYNIEDIKLFTKEIEAIDEKLYKVRNMIDNKK